MTRTRTGHARFCKWWMILMGYGAPIVAGLMWATGVMSVATDHHKELSFLIFECVCYGVVVTSVGLAGIGSLEKEVSELTQQIGSTKSEASHN